MTVVRDDADGLVAWLAPATPSLQTVLADGRGLREVPLAERFSGPRRQVVAPWLRNGILRTYRQGEPWSTWFFWEDDGAFDGWYLNLESPHIREGRHTYSSDHVLDIDIDPDGRMRRKDEDELEAAVEQGRYTADEAARITADAGLAEAAFRAGAWPFRGGWEDWRPEPTWPVPPLP